MSNYQTTSVKAFQDVQADVSRRQALVLAVIAKHPGIDDKSIAALLDKPINEITPRRNELVKAGKVVEAGKHRSQHTGKLVLGWKVPGEVNGKLF